MDHRFSRYRRGLKKKTSDTGVILIGLTGSVAMGKSTLVQQWRCLQRQPIWDADAQVRKLYLDPTFLKKLAVILPEAFNKGLFDKQQLRDLLITDLDKLQVLERLIYPILQQNRRLHLIKMKRFGLRKSVLDIPLLYEKGWDKNCQQVVVVSCPVWLQKQRLLKRPGMTKSYADMLIAQQWPASNKFKRADAIIHTGIGKAFSLRQLRNLINYISGK